MCEGALEGIRICKNTGSDPIPCTVQEGWSFFRRSRVFWGCVQSRALILSGFEEVAALLGARVARTHWNICTGSCLSLKRQAANSSWRAQSSTNIETGEEDGLAGLAWLQNANSCQTGTGRVQQYKRRIHDFWCAKPPSILEWRHLTSLK